MVSEPITAKMKNRPAPDPAHGHQQPLLLTRPRSIALVFADDQFADTQCSCMKTDTLAKIPGVIQNFESELLQEVL